MKGLLGCFCHVPFNFFPHSGTKHHHVPGQAGRPAGSIPSIHEITSLFVNRLDTAGPCPFSGFSDVGLGQLNSRNHSFLIGKAGFQHPQPLVRITKTTNTLSSVYGAQEAHSGRGGHCRHAVPQASGRLLIT